MDIIKKILLVLLLTTCIANAGLQTLGIHYNLTDDVVKPVSIGLTTLHNNKYGTTLGVYGSVSCMTHKEFRFEMGGAFAYSDKLDVYILTGISRPINEDFIIGIWSAPFYNLYNPKFSDDPWGIMAGYRF